MGQYESEILGRVLARLNFLRTRWRWVKLCYYLFACLAFVPFSLLLFSFLETTFWFPKSFRLIIVLAILLIGLYFLLKSLFHFLSIFITPKIPGDITIAGWIERFFPEIRDRLRNALQLISASSDEKLGYSNSLKLLALDEIAPAFLKADLSKAISFKPLIKSSILAGLAILSLSLLFLPSLNSGAHRLFHPFTEYQKPVPFEIAVSPGDTTIVAGDTLLLSASVTGKAPDEINFKLRWQNRAEVEDERVVTNASASVFHLVLPAVNSPFNYQVCVGKVKSPHYEVAVKIPPSLRNLKVKLIPPQYSHLPVINLETNVGDFVALAGTRADILAQVKGEISRAFIIWFSPNSAPDTLNMRLEGNEARAEMKVLESGEYNIRLVNPDGIWDRFPLDYKVEIMPDLSPLVEIPLPGEDLVLAGPVPVKILVQAEDDFGISEMSLFYRRSSTFAPDSTQEFNCENLNFRCDPDGFYRADFIYDLAELQILPGDMVEYFAQVQDNDNINGPKTAKSRIFSLTLPTMAEMYQQIEQMESQSLDEVKEVLEESQKIKENLDRAVEELKRKGDLDWSQKRELEENLKAQKEWLKKLEDANSTLDQMLSLNQESSLMSLELLQKYDELQKLISEISDPDMLKVLEQLSKALEGLDPELLRKSADMFQLSQAEMLERLQKTLDILKQLQLERQLEQLAQLAEDMADRQKEIDDDIPTEKSLPDLAPDENRLKQDMEVWNQDLADTEKLASEKDSTVASELNDLSQVTEGLPEEMGQVSRQLQNSQSASAQQKGENIENSLRSVSQKLSQIKQKMVQQQKDELTNKMLSLVQDLVIISQQQEQLKSESESLSTRSPRFRQQADFQSGIAESLDRVTDRLFELSQKSFFITPEIGQTLGKAASLMNSALKDYTDRNPRSVTPSQTGAMEAVNRSAVMILDAISQMQGSQSATGFNELMQKLQQISSEQAGLNQQTQSMALPMPGASGMSMEQMAAMGRLAAEQRALQQAMNEAAQMAEEVGGTMGQLGNVADNMGEVADSLEDRNVGERTLKLQEKILSRLLDAQKSVRTQRISRERQSRPGEDLARTSPAKISPDTSEEMMMRDILKAMKEGYSADYQRLIREYFRALYEKKEK